MRLDPVRRSAWNILRKAADGSALDPLLETGIGTFAEVRDRAFLAELVRGTLQWQGRYDHVLGCFVRKAPSDKEGVPALLRLALHQILTLESVPAFAAIDQAVELCKSEIHPRLAGFVNGTLRAVARQVLDRTQDSPPSFAEKEARLRPLFAALEKDSAGWLAAWNSHPRWLVERWLGALGPEQTEAMCRFNNMSVPLDFHVLAPQPVAEATRLLEDAGCAVVGAGIPRGLRAAARPPRALLDDLLARFGWLIVQDASVQEATAWLADALGEAPAGAVLDMCAAPGGKTVNLAARLGAGRPLVALEPDPRRMTLLTGTVARTGTDAVFPVLGDGLRPPLAQGRCSAVLLDGPCSGTGVLRHHPEARWRLRPSIPARKADTLLALAVQASDLLASGGVLMYATCSLEAEENLGVLDRLRRERPHLEPVPDAQGRWHRLWVPPSAPGDGFFAAVLRNKRCAP